MIKIYDRNVATERIMRGWSQSELAKNAGISRSTVHLLESGKSVRPAIAKSIADALFVVQQKIEFDRAGQLYPATMEGFVELLLRAKARQGAEEATKQIADILGPATTLEEVEERIRALCTAGYITEQDVDDLLLH